MKLFKEGEISWGKLLLLLIILKEPSWKCFGNIEFCFRLSSPEVKKDLEDVGGYYTQ